MNNQLNIESLQEEAQELLNFGNSTEKAFAEGMLKVIEFVDKCKVHQLWNADLQSTETVIKIDELYGF